MSPGNTRDVLIFASQGSSHHLTKPESSDGLRELLGEDEELAFDSFLNQCQKVFRTEIDSASPEEQSVLGVEARHTFTDPRAFIVPPKSFQSHPVFETITLYVRQVLELLLFESQKGGHHIIETAGICTGVLPAILAAAFSSYGSPDFIQAAVECFRLAFWIGLRAALFCRHASPELLNADPCVLSIFGVSAQKLEEKLADYSKDQSPGSTGPEVRITAVFNDGNISISGQGSLLAKIKSRLASDSIQSRWAHVHACYHGGAELEHMVKEILGDARRRGIEFVTWESLLVPLRSATNGLRMTLEPHSQPRSLLETALHSIFVDRVNWKATESHLREFLLNSLDRDSAARFRVLGFGPGSRSLIDLGMASHPRLDLVENWADSLAQPAADDVAIVGLSVNYPEGKGHEQFWDLLESGRSTLRDIPSSRFDLSQYYEKEQSSHSTPQKLSTKFGNFLQDPFEFDPAYFNISPREAKSIDPQQRLLLQGSLDALEDAGYSPDSTPSLQTATFGVFMGVATGDYVDNLRDDIDVYYSPGTLRAFLSGRISYAFKFKGPAMVIDTACSSSMAALYQACMALKSGQCTAALAGGVNTITSPYMFSGLSRAHFLSPTGQCKPFDESADGYCRSEGCGVVVLKKLSDAVKEGDHIYGVIRGIGVNQCGTSKSITHPDWETQAALARAVLKSSRTSSHTINVVEAHGTGTQAGDFAECSSIGSVFGLRPPTNPLYVSSVKGNIGHAEAASGIASLAKLLLMMEKRKIPRQGSHKKLNPRLGKLIAGRIRIPTKTEEWNRGSGISTRRALLNNFGASGSNAVLVVEEYVRPVTRAHQAQLGLPTSSRPCHVLNISAKTEQALERLRFNYASHIGKNPSLSIADLCYTANARREEYTPYKSSIIASSLGELLERLQQPCSSIKTNRNGKKKNTIFVFSGQGSIHMGMGADLLTTAPQFWNIVDEHDKILITNGFPAVTPFLANSGRPCDAADDIVVSQCACFVLEYALARLWIAWGVTPDIVIGHSIGEYAAFAISGALSSKDALLLLARRARLMAEKCTFKTTGMVACRIPVAEVSGLLSNDDNAFKGMTIACINSPEDLVLAGPLTSLVKFLEYCKEKGIRHKDLQLPLGFHSPSMDPILQDLAGHAVHMAMRPSSVRIGSSLYGRLLNPGEVLEQDYFVKHAREPVNFSSLAMDIAKWSTESNPNIMEIGPSPSTEPMFKKAMSDKPYTFLPSLRPSQPPWATLATALQSLFLQNYRMDWRAIYQTTSAKFDRSLPHYPLTTSSYVVPFKYHHSLNGAGVKPDDDHKQKHFAFIAPTSTSVTGGSTSIFTTTMKQISRFIKAHSVGGVPLCPASIYLEIVLQAITQQGAIDTKTNVCVFENITFDHPLVYSDDGGDSSQVHVQTQLDAPSSEMMEFSSTSHASHVLCAGRIRSLGKATQAVADHRFARKAMHAERLKRSFATESRDHMETFLSKTIYHTIFPRVVEYGEPFLTLQHLTINASGLEGYGTFRLTSFASKLDGRFVSSPVLVDTLLHAAGFIANNYATPDIACICVSVEQAMIPHDSPELYGQDLKVYCSLFDIEHSFIADAYALDDRGKIIAYIEGMCFKKMKLNSFKAHLSRAAGRTASRPAFPLSVPATSGSLRPATQTRLDAGLTNGVSNGQGDVSGVVRSAIREVCGGDLEPVTHTTLVELGVDSLLFIELTELLRRRFPHVDILKSELERCNTVGEIVNVVAEGSDQAFPSSDPPPLLLTTASSSASSTSGTVTPPPEIQSSQALDGNLSNVIKSLFIDVCGLDPTEEEKNFVLSSLGVDSLLAIELFQELHVRLGIHIGEGHEGISNLTYRQLEDLCAPKTPTSHSLISSSEVSQSSPPRIDNKIADAEAEAEANGIAKQVEEFPRALQRRNRQGSSSSLYMFHDGSGLCGMYSRLSSMDRDVYGIFSLDPPPFANAGRQTLEELAATYIERAGLVAQPDVILSGWSFGGVLAFEVSRQLVRKGTSVKGVILIDSPVPISHKALPREIISYVLARATADGRAIKSDAAKKARDDVEAQFKKHAAMLQEYSPGRADAKSGWADVPVVILRCLRTMDTEALCGVTYPWLNDVQVAQESIEKWEKLIGRRIPVLELDCDHFDVFKSANVDDVSEKLKMACEMLDARTVLL